MTSPRYAQSGRCTLFALVCLWIAGCASSGSTPAAEPDMESDESPSLYVVGAGAISVLTSSGTVSRILRSDVSFGGFYGVRSGSSEPVISLRDGSATRLGILLDDGSFLSIHRNPGETEYTGAWSDEGNLAFGYVSAEGKGIGIYDSDGTTDGVGCNASSRVLGWAGKDRLVVADADNRYVVSASGCATISRVDAKKLHEIDFNPKKPIIAYILRELEYDRAARQYVPDSSLHISDPDGDNDVLVVGNRYRPHRPSWSPDGRELAFDAQIPDRPDRRLISVYDLETGSSAFLNPSSLETRVSEWDAHWSPSGSNIAYVQKYGDGAQGVTVRPMSGSFTTLVGESGERFARWIDDNYLVVTDGSTERLVSTDGTMSFRGPEGATILRFE